MNFLSLTTVPIEIIAQNDQVVGKATGFFYKSESGSLYLVTNWHVVTGRQPSNPKFSEKGAIPAILRCRVHMRQEEKRIIRLNQLKELSVPINALDGNQPEWFEHPDYRHRVDVVAVPIEPQKQISDGCRFHILNDFQGFEPRYEHAAMDDIFVIGYPWGLSGSGGSGALPIYKRGSIASEPRVNYLGLPRFLIDCRTAESMSGAPVIVRHNGIWNPSGAGFSRDSVIGTIENFVGVYSGRLLSQEGSHLPHKEVSDIGIVWNSQSLEEVINKGVAGMPLKDISHLPN